MDRCVYDSAGASKGCNYHAPMHHLLKYLRLHHVDNNGLWQGTRGYVYAQIRTSEDLYHLWSGLLSIFMMKNV